MNSGCSNCTGAITEQKAKDDKIIQQAKERAITEGRSYAIYRNEYGETGYIPATEAAGYPITGFVTFMQGS